MRLIWRILLGSVALAIGGSAAVASQVDPALAGTWRATGKLMTSSMVKSGEFRLRIGRDGRYSLVSAPGSEFVIDGGRFEQLGRVGYHLRTATGTEDRGSVALAGGGFRLSGTFGSFELQPASANAAQDAALDRVATVFAMQGLRSVGAWTSRAMQLALLWRGDAQLVSISALDFDEQGLLTPRSSLNLRFYSRAADRLLVLAPVRTDLAAFAVFETTRDRRTPTRGIPVPIRDLQELVHAVRAQGNRARLVNARLQFFDESGRGAQLLWLTDVSGSMQRWCLTGTRGELVDCRRWAGDPEADYGALAKRAAAGWRVLQDRWSGASAGPAEPSAMDRCLSIGATWRYNTCYSFWRPDETIYP